MHLHIIYTETDMLLSKKAYESWRSIQDEFSGYKASLGPWAEEAVIEYLASDYSNLNPSAAAQVEALISGIEEVQLVTFQVEGGA